MPFNYKSYPYILKRQVGTDPSKPIPATVFSTEVGQVLLGLLGHQEAPICGRLMTLKKALERSLSRHLT